MLSTKGYSSSGSSFAGSHSAATSFALPFSVGKLSSKSTAMPSEVSGSGFGRACRPAEVVVGEPVKRGSQPGELVEDLAWGLVLHGQADPVRDLLDQLEVAARLAGASSTGWESCTRRSVFVNVPSFSM